MRILVVEDEHRIGNSLKKGLEQEAYAVDLIYDGSEGFDQACVESYDLIILDRMLPGMDGIEICKGLRKKNLHIPILMLTAKDRVEDKVEGLDAGADDYLAKPFAFEELLARIRALKRRPNKQLGEELMVDDLTLNTNTYEVKRMNKIISLSQKEFSLLEYLLRNKDKTVSKDQIVSHVWDYDSDILPNTIEAFIKNLRNKIEKPFSNGKKLIYTVRGFGYKISENN